MTPMSLGLSHSLSRYKLKFSPDKVSLPQHSRSCCMAGCITFSDWHTFTRVFYQTESPNGMQVDTMIVQAIALLDDLDKELNTYAMRVREWYGWHFPEMTKIVSDNIMYAKTVSASPCSVHFS